MHRGIGLSFEVIVENELVFILLHVEIGDQFAGVEGRVIDIHQNCALLLQHFEGIGHHAVDLLVVGAASEQGTQHPNAHTLQAIAVERGGIGRGTPADAQPRHRIIGIVAGHHIEHDCGVGYGSRYRPNCVLRKRARDHPRAADQSTRGTNAHEAVS